MKTFSVTVLFVLGAAAIAAAITAFATDESTSVEMGAVCLLFPGGSGARAGPPSDTGYDSSLYMLQADFMDTTNLTGGAAAATAVQRQQVVHLVPPTATCTVISSAAQAARTRSAPQHQGRGGVL
eukprot:SAG31_NODE_9621_length_1249_cov_9.288696_2_plen_125_part_00